MLYSPFSLQDPNLNFLEGGVSNLNSALDILDRADDGSATERPEDQAAASSGSFKPHACMENGKWFTMSLILYVPFVYGYVRSICWDSGFIQWFNMNHRPRLCFPTIQENTSAVAVLPHFIEVCGRKIDNCGSVLDWWGWAMEIS